MGMFGFNTDAAELADHEKRQLNTDQPPSICSSAIGHRQIHVHLKQRVSDALPRSTPVWSLDDCRRGFA